MLSNGFLSESYMDDDNAEKRDRLVYPAQRQIYSFIFEAEA